MGGRLKVQGWACEFWDSGFGRFRVGSLGGYKFYGLVPSRIPSRIPSDY